MGGVGLEKSAPANLQIRRDKIQISNFEDSNLRPNISKGFQTEPYSLACRACLDLWQSRCCGHFKGISGSYMPFYSPLLLRAYHMWRTWILFSFSCVFKLNRLTVCVSPCLMFWVREYFNESNLAVSTTWIHRPLDFTIFFFFSIFPSLTLVT